MKKILIIAPPLIRRSGWGRYSMAVIDELKGRVNVRVKVIAEDNPAAESSDFTLQPLLSLRALLINLKNTREAARDMDIVHSLESWPYSLYGLYAVLGTKKELFINAVGTYSLAPLRHFFKGWLLRRAYSRAKKIMCISNYTKKRLQAEIESPNLVTIHLGFNKLPEIAEEDMERCKKQFELTISYPVILTVGGIKYRKGQLDTLKAATLLKDEFPNITYVIIGSAEDGAYISKIKFFAEEHKMMENLKIYHNIEDKELNALYAIADVVALNSNNDREHFEGFGLTLIEANASGTPVVGSRNTGIEDALEDGVNGLLTDQGNERDIAEAIKRIIAGNYKKMSDNSKTFSRRFSWKTTVDNYEKAYSERLY